MDCRYCGVDDIETDIYVVSRNGKLEGFCLPCYEKNLDDKRKGWTRWIRSWQRFGFWAIVVSLEGILLALALKGLGLW